MSVVIKQPLHVGVVGLGLIGGSAAKSLKARTPHTVYAADRDAGVLECALREDAVDKALNDSALAELHVLLVALYPAAAVDYLRGVAGKLKSGAVVIDLCGVKRRVAKEMAEIAREHGLRYIGGHPMAGREKSGYECSDADLFFGAPMILTPLDADGEAVMLAEELFLAMGFGMITMSDPEEHDHMIAYTSQLAHVLSNAYIKSPWARRYKGFSAGSFQDMTRVAYLNEEMWAELFLQNGDYLADEVEGLAARLIEYAKAIRQGDASLLRGLLADGRREKELMTGGGKL